MRQLDIFGNVIEVTEEEVAKDGLQKKLQQVRLATATDDAKQDPQNHIEITPDPSAEPQVTKHAEQVTKSKESDEPMKAKPFQLMPERLTTDEFLDAKIKAAKARIKQQLQQEALAAKSKTHDPGKPTPQKRGRKSLKEQPAEADAVEIPGDEVLFQKQYYPMGVVAKWFKVNQSLLRFWENEFDILKPRKTRKGSRLFRPEDVKNLQLIHHLVREKKYTLEGAKEFMKTNRQRAEMQLKLTQTLQKFKGFLLELKANLQE